jgi:hypothetical protein
LIILSSDQHGRAGEIKATEGRLSLADKIWLLDFARSNPRTSAVDLGTVLADHLNAQRSSDEDENDDVLPCSVSTAHALAHASALEEFALHHPELGADQLHAITEEENSMPQS